ncbi:Aste57867_13122 [Aphanomyces stellatus]|uniref:Aste57867_13122 protein n=1 Tax=Aphanomyces stellatus TaxID=120398 RepID=A0A485KXB2_9STRA|nr:hypothetical protein As57867_013073 [Aphanomyces stellatus]VFT89964.1 Aste57867_13122 [Aphanomyces stellatus]
MNPLLFVYLNFVRGPQIMAARHKKEEEERQAKAALEGKDGEKKDSKKPEPKEAPKLQVLASCKKCERQVPEEELEANFSLCDACASNPMALLTPFVVFQLIGILVALSVLVYRWTNGLPLV